jgi:xylulokinase
VLHELAERTPDARGILVAGQMGGLILVDAAGRPLKNYRSWRDQRTLAPHPAGGTFLQAARKRLTDEQFAQLGSELAPGSATALGFWLAEQGELPRGAIPATASDFAIARLCNTLPRMHRTHAVGLLHLASGQWHREALAALGLADFAWPQLAGELEPIGSMTIAGRSYSCYPALGDQQCALRGAGLAPDELSLNISTGSQVSRRTAQLALGPYLTRPYFGGEYLNTITHLPAGRSLNVLVDLLTELPRRAGIELPSVWQSIAAAIDEAESAAAGGLACDLAFFAGPLGNSGSITGITTENLTVGNLFRAALTNMADNYSRCADRLWPARDWQRVRISGGLTQSLPLLRQLVAARFPQPLCESAAEETLLGLVDVAREIAPTQT